MRNFQHRDKFKHIFQSWPVLAILGVIILFFAWNVLLFVGKMRATIEKKNIAETQVAGLLQKKEKLTEDIEKLKTEEGREESIREKFGLVKEGEGVIVVVDEKEKDKKEPTDSGGLFSFFKKLFKRD